ncbi:putative Ig domain-containing protein [Empedobacter falsenii]
MKKIYFKSSLLTLLLSGFAFGQGSETFETQTALSDSYQTGSFDGETIGIEWNYTGARNEGSYPITNKGILFQKSGNTLETTIANGIGKLSFDVRKAFTGGTNNRKIEVLVDGVIVYTSPTFGGSQTDATIHSYEVEINKTDATLITFRNAGPQLTLDNISWTKAPEITEAPTVSPKTITGTYGVLLTDGQITATNNPTSWAQTGALPSGIEFNTNEGLFFGTPTQAGTFTTQVTATNEIDTSTAAAVTFEIAKANQTVNYTFENITQDQGTTFAGLPTQTEQGVNIVYTSADNSIVSTNGNTLSFDGIGSTTITATALSTDNFNEYTTTFDVRANDPNATYCFEETFDGLNGNNTSGTGSNTAWNGNSNFPTTSSAYQAGEAVRLGTSSKTGAITSKTLDEISGNVTVSFDVKGWTSVEGSMNVTLGTETKNVAYTAAIANAFENVTVSFDNVAAGSTLKLETSAKRAFIDNVKIQCSATNSSTTWENGAWSNGEPDLTKEAVLKAVPTASFSAKKLTVENEMTIPAGITITVENEVVNNATLSFEHGAYLIQNNDNATNVGTAIFNRKSTPIYRLENMTWSSPVVGQNIFEISPNTLTNRFTRFDEATNTWVANVTASDVFEAGEMIGFRAPNNYNNYGQGEAKVFESSFTGQIYNGEVTIPVVKTTEGNNAIGNPYASPINLDALIAANTTVGVNAVYVWTHSKHIVDGVYQGGSNWAIYNGIGWNDAAVTSSNLDIAQGFIAQVANTGNLVLNNSMRVAANNPVYFKGQKNRYWLTLSNNENSFSSSLIGYVSESTTEYDQNFDAKPFEKSQGLYSLLNNDLYVIQGRGDFDKEDSFELAYNVKDAGTYQINLEKFEGVFENQNIYLVDKKLNKVVNLSELKSYSFETEAGEINDRFEVIYQNKTLSSNDLSKVKGLVVYAKNKQITISSDETIKSIKLVDISGRQLQNVQNVNAKSYVLNLNVNPQVVVVVVEKNNGKTESKKVILK